MKLEVNNKDADYFGVIAISRRGFDIEDIDSRFIDITNKFEIPPSDKNNKIFNIPNRLESSALDDVYKAKVIDSTILFNGTGTLTQSGAKRMFQITDDSKVFFNDLNQQLKELDLESDDFIYTTANYNILREKTSSVWVWPIVQMHESISASDLQYLRPHFRMWSLLQNIFESRGWTLEMDTTLIEDVAIQANSENFYFTSYEKTLNGSSVGDLTINDFEHAVTVALDSVNVGTNKTSFRIRGVIKSIGVSTMTFGDDIFTFQDGEHYYDLTTSENEGVVLISSSGTLEFKNTLLYTTIAEKSFDDLDSFDPTSFKVKTYDNLPDLNQIDLFRDAIKYTLSIITPDSLNRIVKLRTLANLSTQNRYDWTEKYIEDSETISSNIGGISKKNLITYINKVGDGFFNSSIDYLKDESTYLAFRYAGSADKANHAVYNTYEVDSDGNNVRKSSEGIRVVAIDVYNGKFTPLNWDNLTVNYYNDYFKALNKPRQIVCNFNLSKLDVLGFDFLKMVYLRQYNAIFVVQVIENFIPGEKTTVKLLRYGR